MSISSIQLTVKRYELADFVIENESNDNKFDSSLLQNPENTQKTLPNILFYKTHKTGSTTIKNVLFRLALKHNRTIVWPVRDGDAGFAWPNYFTPQNVKNKLHTGQIVLHHQRFHPSVFDMFPGNFTNAAKTRKENLFQFTIIREPFSMFKSSFNYMGAELNLGGCMRKAKTVKNYLDNFEKFSAGYTKPSHCFCNSATAFDLGYNAFETDPEIIRNMVQELDERLDLVLILDKYWESLIILKFELNLEYQDVIAFHQNRALERKVADLEKPEFGLLGFDKKNQTEFARLKNLARQHFKPDTAIYDFFSAKFEQKLAKFDQTYGKTRMAYEISILKNLTQFYEQEICQIREILPQGTHGEFLKNQNIPKNMIPYKPPGVPVTTILVGENVTQITQPKYYDDCINLVMPGARACKYIENLQKEYGLIEYKNRRKRENFESYPWSNYL